MTATAGRPMMDTPLTVTAMLRRAIAWHGFRRDRNPPSQRPGSSGTITIPGTVEGTTVVTFFATDSSGTVESLITNDSSAKGATGT